MRAFNLFVIHSDDQAKKELLCKMCTFLDPDPYWNYPVNCYGSDSFTHYYDQSLLVNSDVNYAASVVGAWGIHSQCSESFYNGIDLWGNPANDDYFKTLMGIDDAELATLKTICTWEKVATYVDGVFPVTATAQAAGYDITPNYDQAYIDAKKAELGYG